MLAPRVALQLGVISPSGQFNAEATRQTPLPGTTLLGCDSGATDNGDPSPSDGTEKTGETPVPLFQPPLAACIAHKSLDWPPTLRPPASLREKRFGRGVAMRAGIFERCRLVVMSLEGLPRLTLHRANVWPPSRPVGQADASILRERFQRKDNGHTPFLSVSGAIGRVATLLDPHAGGVHLPTPPMADLRRH
jgi:hypothetical protein